MRSTPIARGPLGRGLTAALSALVGASLVGCSGATTARPDPGTSTAGARTSGYAAPVVAGYLESDDITESSGLSASECQDVLWTHNDSGNDSSIFAMDTAGRHLGTWRVENSRNVDWESIAGYRDPAGRCSLIIADIGDNDENRGEVELYRIAEPVVSAQTARSSRANPLRTEPAQSLTLTYPNGSNNAETLLVHPRTGGIYIVTKKKKGPAAVYRFEPEFGAGRTVTGREVAEVSVPSKREGQLTGGSVSPDGTRVMLCDEKGGYELVLPAGATDPDEIWRQRPREVDLGERPQGEGVSYGRDGATLYASSEKKNSPLYLIKRG